MNRFAYALGVLGCMFALACGGDASVETDDHEVEGSGGGESVAQYEGPITGDAAAGADIFATNCAGCHPGVGPDLQGHNATVAESRQIVREGEDRMPAFGSDKISDQDLENVLAYMQDTYGMFASAL